MSCKICLVSLAAYPYFNPKSRGRSGGAELQLYYLAKGLAEDSNFDISFIVGDFGQDNFEIRERVKLYKLLYPKRGILKKAILGPLRLWKLLQSILPDIIIQRAAGWETIVTSLFCKARKEKFVYMVASDEELGNKRSSFFPKGFFGLLLWYIFKLCLKNADLIFVQHQNQKEALKKNFSKEGIIRKSAHYIPNHIKIENKSLILWVARCESWKQPEIFIRLAKEFPKERFVMVCPFSNNKDYFEKIKKEALELRNIEFIEYVQFEEIENYFLNSKIFVITSRIEGFPNTLIQAAKTKTPILSLNINPDNILEEYKMGIFAQGDFTRLKCGLKELLENKALWNEIAENGLKYANEHHNLKKIIEEDKRIFLNLGGKNERM